MKPAAIPTLALLVLGSACDIALLPEGATYEGEATPRMAVVVATDAMPAGEVEAVDVEIVDVLLHRDRDDAWIWIGGNAKRVELSPSHEAREDSVPLLADHYDRVLVVLDAPRVASSGKWHAVGLAQDEIELAVDIDLDADARLELHFDVAASLKGKSPKQWSFSPQVRAEIVAE